ncbi:MAG: DUF86 domain-containing protein [Bacteroidales bacterium]|nr:DUF86 domain-containing protein [Bacteroidales bacterium]
MASTSYDKSLVAYKITQWIEGIDDIFQWNESIKSADDYTSSMEGMKTLAATAMLLQAIGEGIKKVDSITNGSLFELRPEIPWRQIKGMRDHIAHGYFEINAELVYDVVNKELMPLKEALSYILNEV